MMRFLVPLVFGLTGTGTYIHEFRHSKLTVHFHPSPRQFKLADLEKALGLRVHAVEIDLNYGSYTREFYSHFPAPVIDRLCIVERHRYDGEITSLSKNKGVFQWVSIQHSGKEGEDAERVRKLHAGTDKLVPGKFNVRIWDCHRDLDVGLAAGADSLNCDLDEIQNFQRTLKR